MSPHHRWITYSLLILCTVFSSLASAKESPKNADFEQRYKDIANGATAAVQHGIRKLHETVNNTSSPDERNLRGFVNSTEVLTFKNIPQHVNSEIKDIRKRIKTIIFMAATDIEQTGSSGKASLEQGELRYLPKDAKDKYLRLMEAKKLNNVSVRSLNLAIKMLTDLNQQLINAAEKETQIDRRNNLYITQAAYVFEMADIVLEVVDKVNLEGKATIEALHQDYKNKVQQRQQEIDKELADINQSAQSGSISTDYAQKLNTSYAHMKKANQIGLQAWTKVMGKIQQQDNWLNKMKAMRDTIRFKRNEAKFQLATLRDLGVLRGVNKIVDNMDQLVTTVGSMELLVLDEGTVRCLIFGSQATDCSDL